MGRDYARELRDRGEPVPGIRNDMPPAARILALWRRLTQVDKAAFMVAAGLVPDPAKENAPHES